MITPDELNTMQARADAEDVPRLVAEVRRLWGIEIAARKLDESLREYHHGYGVGESYSQEHDDLRNVLDPGWRR